MGAAGSVADRSAARPPADAHGLADVMFPSASSRKAAKAAPKPVRKGAQRGALASATCYGLEKPRPSGRKPLEPLPGDWAPPAPGSGQPTAPPPTPPSLSMVGVTDLSRLLAPPPRYLRFEARAGVLTTLLQHSTMVNTVYDKSEGVRLNKNFHGIAQIKLFSIVALRGGVSKQGEVGG